MNKLLIIFVLLLGVANMTTAQDNGVFFDPEEYCQDDMLPTYSTVLDQADNILYNEELGSLDFRLSLITMLISSVRALCDDYTFTSDEYGTDWVSDGILFNNGTYRMVLESEGRALVESEAIEGNCGFIYEFTGSEGGREQTAVTLTDCYGVLEVDSDVSWTLIFEPIYRNEDG